jgi:hypothetical protein
MMVSDNGPTGAKFSSLVVSFCTGLVRLQMDAGEGVAGQKVEVDGEVPVLVAFP